MGCSCLDIRCHGNLDDAGVQFPLAHHGQNNELQGSGDTLAVYGSNTQVYYLSLCMRKPTIWVPTRSDTNQPVQSKGQARSLKFWN